MSNLVIVAVPDENDRVWKISSEKVPHLTLLFLGDVAQVSNLEKIVEFVQHAANTTLSRFYLPVDRRGELGDDPETGPADVLFFKKGRYDYKAIRDFRAALLQDNNIKTAYDSAQQFEGPWQPHLTLGYQASPANEMKDGDYPIYDVCFNKIAVWTGDFNGPEFLLKDQWDEFDALESVPMDVAMSDISDTTSRGEVVLHKSVLDNPTLAQQIKDKIQSILDDVTGDADKDLSLFGDPLIRTKIQSVLEDFYKDPNVDNAMVYDALGAAFLEHYGVKGMKWGVRKDLQGRDRFNPTGHKTSDDIAKAFVLPPGLSAPAHIRLARRAGSKLSRKGAPEAVPAQATSHVPRGSRLHTKVKTEGGQNHPAHEDAIKVARSQAKLKKSGPAALSNQELRDVSTRLQLEQQVKQLSTPGGKRFVTGFLKTQGQQSAGRVVTRKAVARGL